MHSIRKRKLSGLTKSDGTIRCKKNRRVYFLFFDNVDHGQNGGNTAAGTWRVLQIVKEAMVDKSYKDDGWKGALNVRNPMLIMLLTFACMYVIKFLNTPHPCHLFIIFSSCVKNVAVCQLFDDF